MGCIGKDQNAEIMINKAKDVGLNTAYQVDEATPTGTCAVLITGKDRLVPRSKIIQQSLRIKK